MEKRGVTLIELLVVIGISIILLSLGTIGFSYLKANYELVNATNELFADFEWIRQKSIGSPHRFGIKFSSNSYKVFEDRNDNGKDDTGEELKIKTYKHINLSGYPAPGIVLYDRKGTANNSFTITLTHKNGKAKQITISLFRVEIR